VFCSAVAARLPAATVTALHESSRRGQQRGIDCGFRTEQLLEPRLHHDREHSVHTEGEHDQAPA